MAFNGRFVVNIADFASRHVNAFDEIIALAGQPLEILCTEESTVDYKTYNRIMERAAELTNDDFFGLHAGENLNMSAAGLIGQITQSSETVLQALQYCCDFANLGCSSLPMIMNQEANTTKVVLIPDIDWAQDSSISLRHTAEGVLAFTVREYQTLTRDKYFPLRITLPWSPPNSIEEYRRILGCEIIFDQPDIAIVFQNEHVNEKIVTSDYKLLRILVDHAQEKTVDLGQKKFYNIVKRSIVNLVKPEFPTIEQVASHLNVSVRTLQRKLQEDGHTFKELIEELRKEFALSYLKNPDLTISEIAYLLNYSEASAFNRSFKRWTGQTPKNYRTGKTNY